MNDFSLDYLAKLLLKRMTVLILTAVLFAGFTYAYCKYLATPSYSATGSIVVTNGSIIAGSDNTSSSINNSDIAASLSLSATVVDILNTNDIYKDLAASIGNKYTYQQLKSHTHVNRRADNTLFIDVSFSSLDSQEAVVLLNAYLEMCPEYVAKYIPSSTVTVPTLADNAVMTYPRTLVLTVDMAIVGFVLAAAIVIVANFFNHSIQNEEDFKSHYDIMLLGAIPDFSATRHKEYSRYKRYGYGSYGKDSKQQKGANSNG